ncbi:adenosylcobinamide-GDP ribazoletransferase [Microvirga antarctica]|uniref:adenosylcobinamide-GDP ribazoletransferase n=1 Tax=Microvirga antarctica TaxID=2819233 RepID=UPI001B312CDE|nr:adenosylcobinamide-GDP ribazoletransferase [Microvirga antarctica]
MSDHIHKTGSDASGAWQDNLVRLAQALRFFSRLPVPRLPFESADPHAAPALDGLVRVVPIAGLIIGILPGFVMVVALALGLGPWLAAILTVTALTLITGGLHEDGLADTADGLGGATRERRLAIMRDSLIGSYGASALILAFALRIAALAALAPLLGIVAGVAVVMIAASLSRTAALMPLVFLPPARTDGLSRSVGQPRRESFLIAATLAALLAVAIGLLAGLPASGLALMIGFSGLAGFGLTRLADRNLGGQTGDIAGAAQQIAEIAALIGLLIALAR